MNPGRLIRTLWPFRTSQLLWRVKTRIENISPLQEASWKWQGSLPPKTSSDFPALHFFGSVDLSPERILKSLADNRLCLLNEELDLGFPNVNWRLGNVSSHRLWTITLHYHEWLSSLAELGVADTAIREKIIAFLNDWMISCRLSTNGSRSLAWNSYAIATRIRSWIRIWNRLEHLFPINFRNKLLDVLWLQACYLRDHLEWDLRANHLLRDAVGLAWAGRFFNEPVAQEWMECATKIAVEQSLEQVLPDGGHFERSPMYHMHALHDFMELKTLVVNTTASSELAEIISRMQSYLRWTMHPDGTIPLFNDAAHNGAGDPTVLTASSIAEKSPPKGGKVFPETGTVVWHSTDWTIFLDAGIVGPDQQPGHAHADTLTMEISYLGNKLIVDPGTYSYDQDKRRRYDRSTAAHNTVCIDGFDSSEVWHIFRLGRRAKVSKVSFSFDPKVTFEATHAGYSNLHGAPIHRRHVQLNPPQNSLDVEDEITGNGPHNIEGGWLIAPGWTVNGGGGTWQLSFDEARLAITISSKAMLTFEVKQCPYHPEYGKELIANRIVWKYNGQIPVKIKTTFEPQ